MHVTVDFSLWTMLIMQLCLNHTICKYQIKHISSVPEMFLYNVIDMRNDRIGTNVMSVVLTTD